MFCTDARSPKVAQIAVHPAATLLAWSREQRWQLRLRCVLTAEVSGPAVAAHWRDNYDLVHILRRDWGKGLGRKLEGKIHVYVGDMDNYYLNNAVYEAEKALKAFADPAYGGEVDYGDRAEHCWNGDHTRPNAISRLRYHQMFIPRIAERILKTAPPGADLTSWRY